MGQQPSTRTSHACGTRAMHIRIIPCIDACEYVCVRACACVTCIHTAHVYVACMRVHAMHMHTCACVHMRMRVSYTCACVYVACMRVHAMHMHTCVCVYMCMHQPSRHCVHACGATCMHDPPWNTSPACTQCTCGTPRGTSPAGAAQMHTCVMCHPSASYHTYMCA